MTGAAQLTNSKLAAQLVEGCLAHISGNLPNKISIASIPATDLERASVGLQQGGQTMFYPLADSGVFIDLHGAVATVWYVGGDYERGLEALESMLKSGRKVKQLKDESAGAAGQRVRDFEVDLGSKRVAHVIADYAERGSRPERFRVRVIAQVRK